MSGEELRAAAQAVVSAWGRVSYVRYDGDEDGLLASGLTLDDPMRALRAALAAPSTPEPSGLAAILGRHVAGPHRTIRCEWAGYADEDACPDRRDALRAAPSTEPALDAIRSWWNDGPRKTWREDFAEPETRDRWFAELAARLAESQS